MSLEEFVEKYTPLELEKMTRTDPVKVFSKNVAVNKAIAGRKVHEMQKSKLKPYTYKNYAPVIADEN